MEISTIGIDLSKTTFHMIGLSARGEIVLRKKLSRKQLRPEKRDLSNFDRLRVRKRRHFRKPGLSRRYTHLDTAELSGT